MNGLQAYHGKAARLIVQPDDGVAAVIALIEGAQRSIRIKMFELTTQAIVAALIDAKARDVEVEVLLNQVRSSGLRPNDGTMQMLRDGGVASYWASRHFAITHEKSMVVDDARVLISTFNFSDKYFGRTRDYGVLIEDAAIVAEVIAGFEADKAGRSFDVPAKSPLAWGNRTARSTMVDFIDAAQTQLLIQHPKFRDAAILERVFAARDRGVAIKYLCGGTHGIEDQDLIATLSYQRILGRAGVHLKRQRRLKLHAKLLIADNARALLGSMNIDRDGFDIRRELGIVLGEAKTIAALEKIFDADWHEAKHWEPPDPMRLDIDTAVDAEPDPVPEILHD